MSVGDVDLHGFDVVALDVLDQVALLQARPFGEDDDGRQQRVLDVVDVERVHLPAEVQQVVNRVFHAGHLVRLLRVRAIVGE